MNGVLLTALILALVGGTLGHNTKQGTEPYGFAVLLVILSVFFGLCAALWSHYE